MTNILTLRLDAASQAYFERLRQRHYPAERNQIAAHLTLFHTLPDETWVGEALAAVAAPQTQFAVAVTGLRSLGKGVAYTMRSPQLETLHRALAESFAAELTAQDRQRFMPHIVVQNKSTAAQARALLAQLQGSFEPMEVRACGMDLWNYMGGPWTHAQHFPFELTANLP